MTIRRITLPTVVVGLLVLSGWQAWGDAALIATNQRFLADRDGFYTREAPGFYFSDWRQAGRWIHDNTPAHARILSWQAATGGTAHRFQRRVQFEALTPEKVRQQIASFPARFLVVTSAQFGLGFGWQQTFADPAYTLSVVYQDRDVTILEATPNRNGAVSRTGYAEWIQSQRIALDAVLQQYPDRLDLITRKADLLQEVGENSQAIQLLEGLVQRGVVTVRVCSALGWLYFSDQQYARAAEYLDLARGLPNAEPVAESLADGARRARERLADSTDESLEKSIERSLRRIQNQVAGLNLAKAEREVDRLLAKAPDHGALNYWRGYLHHLFGETELAEKCYEAALRGGSDEARGKLLLLRLERAVAQSSAAVVNIDGASEPVDPTTMAAHVRLAKLYDEHGWSGRALARLESARLTFGDQPEILSPLADLYFRFARPEDAAPLYRLAQEAWPHEKSLRQGQAAAEGALRKPRF